MVGIEVGINPIDYEKFGNDVTPVFAELFFEKAVRIRPGSTALLESVPSPKLAILDVSELPFVNLHV